MPMTRFIERLARGDRPTVLGLGDSLTFGYMVPRGYLHILRDLLVSRAPKAPPIIDNQGSCGDTAAGAGRGSGPSSGTGARIWP